MKGTRKKAALKKSAKSSYAFDQVRVIQNEMAAVIRTMEEKVRQLACLNGLSSLINSASGLSEVLRQSLQVVCQLTGAEAALLFLIDPIQGDLCGDSVYRLGHDPIDVEIRLPIDHRSFLGHVAATGQGLIISGDDARVLQAQVEGLPTGLEIQGALCEPLHLKGTLIGVIQAMNKGAVSGGSGTRCEFTHQDRSLLQVLTHQIAFAVENVRLASRVKSHVVDAVAALAEAIEKKDRYTGGHTKRVVYYSESIAQFLGLTPDQCEQVRLSAVLHDVGKIGIDDKILKKNAPLDEAEWVTMKTHPELGFQIMSKYYDLPEVSQGIRFHHERWDGQGYPQGLKGTEIPLVARIIAVADAYDAIVSTRPYRKGADPLVAYQEIVKNSGTQFDPEVVEAFIAAFKSAKMGQGSGESALRAFGGTSSRAS